MKVLALDVASHIGIAVGESGSVPLCWSEYLGGPPDERRFSQAIRLTDQLIREHKPEFIAVEAAVGGPKASAYLIGLLACVRGIAFLRGIPCEALHLAAIRKHFVGKNLTVKDFPGMKHAQAKKAIKQVVIQRCRVLGWTVPDDNAADAGALWDYACSIKAPGYQARPVGGLF